MPGRCCANNGTKAILRVPAQAPGESTLTRAGTHLHDQSSIATRSPRTLRHISALLCVVHKRTDTSAARLFDCCSSGGSPIQYKTEQHLRSWRTLGEFGCATECHLSPTRFGRVFQGAGSRRQSERAWGRTSSMSHALNAMRHRPLIWSHKRMGRLTRDDETGVFATSVCSEYFRFIQSARKIPRNATRPTVFKEVFSKSPQSAGRRTLQTNGAYEVGQLTLKDTAIECLRCRVPYPGAPRT